MQTLFDQVKSDLQSAFEIFDKANPKIWELFKEFAFRAINEGRTHYGSKKIFEEIRYHTCVVTNDPGFKLNNDYSAYYARKFMDTFPAYKGFFETRKIKNGTSL